MVEVSGQQQATSGSCFERTHVKQVYDEIASSVNDIQHKAWPNVKRFLKKLEPGLLVADVGCGNGRYLNINNNIFKIGMDVCQPLVDKSRSKGHEVAHADNLHIPFREGTFDAVISIGVIHHFCSSKRRIRAVQELSRIMTPGGRIMIYVWAFEQKRRKFDSQDVLVPWHERKDLTRNDSISSYTSSISRISSTSSVSEDDSLETFDNDNSATWEKHEPPALQIQSTVSMENLEALSNFEPNYYALYFSSPIRKASFDFKCISLNDEGKKELVKECRKLETSLRTMSAGLLCESPPAVYDRGQHEASYSCDRDYQHGSLENMNSINKRSACTGFVKPEKSNNLSVVNGHSTDGSCLSTGITTNNSSKNGQVMDKKTDKRILQSSIQKTFSAQVNPFLKTDSIDTYTFNNIEKPNQASNYDSVVEESGSISPVIAIDEVFVRFSGPKNLKKQGSVFSLFKSKLSKLFADDKNSSTEKLASTTYLAQFPEPELSDEQRKMAAKLNFAVREFPKSSQPIGLLPKHDKITTPHLPTVEVSEARFKTQHSPQVVFTLNDPQLDDNDPASVTDNAKGYVDVLSSSNLHDIHLSQLNSAEEQPRRKSIAFDALWNSLSQEVSSDEPDFMTTDVLYDSYMKIDIDRINGETNNDICSALPVNICEKMNDKENANIEYAGVSVDGLILGKATRTSVSQRESGINSSVKCDIGKCDIDNGLCNNCVTQLCNMNDDATHSSMYTSRTRNASSKDKFLSNSNALNSTTPTSKGLQRNMSQDEVPVVSCMEEVDVLPLSRKLSRYYHVFREGELEELISSHVPELQVVQSFYDHANWCVIAEKV